MSDIGTSVHINIFSDLGSVFSQIELAHTPDKQDFENISDKPDIAEINAVPTIEKPSSPDKELFMQFLNNYQQKELTFSDILHSGLFHGPEIAQINQIQPQSSLFETAAISLPALEFPILDNMILKSIEPPDIELAVSASSEPTDIAYDIPSPSPRTDFVIPEMQFPTYEFQLPELQTKDIQLSLPDIPEHKDISFEEFHSQEFSSFEYEIPQYVSHDINLDIVKSDIGQSSTIDIAETISHQTMAFELPETGFRPLEWETSDIGRQSDRLPFDLPIYNAEKLSFPEISYQTPELGISIQIPDIQSRESLELPKETISNAIPDISIGTPIEYAVENLPNISGNESLTFNLPIIEPRTVVPDLNIAEQQAKFEATIPETRSETYAFDLPEFSQQAVIPELLQQPPAQALQIETPAEQIYAQLEFDIPRAEYQSSEFELPLVSFEPIMFNTRYNPEFPSFNPDLEVDQGEFKRPDVFDSGLHLDMHAISYDNNPSLNSGGLQVWS
jgi:hypothetical protein